MTNAELIAAGIGNANANSSGVSNGEGDDDEKVMTEDELDLDEAVAHMNLLSTASSSDNLLGGGVYDASDAHAYVAGEPGQGEAGPYPMLRH